MILSPRNKRTDQIIPNQRFRGVPFVVGGSYWPLSEPRMVIGTDETLSCLDAHTHTRLARAKRFRNDGLAKASASCGTTPDLSRCTIVESPQLIADHNVAGWNPAQVTGKNARSWLLAVPLAVETSAGRVLSTGGLLRTVRQTP